MKQLSALLVLLITTAPLLGQQAAEQIQAYLQEITNNDAFSGTVLIAKGDQVLLSKGYGHAVIEHQIPNDVTTRFRIGSITKQFTAMAIMQLVEAGKLKLDGALSDYLPDYPKETGDRITIHHLLTHSSGIPSYTSMEEIMDKRGSLQEAPEDFVKHFCDEPLEFEPGSTFKYNNSGYYLLGMIIEQVSGQTYADYLQKNIFDPVGMKATGVEYYRAVIPNMANGYSALGEYPERSGNIVTDMAYAAGAMYSTVGDLLTWHRALLDKKLISEDSYRLMFTSHLDGYGYGWGIAAYDDQPMYAHSGGIDGFSSMGILLPEEKLSIIVLANLESANAGKIATDLNKIYHGKNVKALEAPKIADIDPAIFDKYVGTYNLFPNFDIRIFREKDKLMAQATNQGSFQLHPESETLFFIKEVAAKIEFVRGDNGQIEQLILHQNGEHSGKRIK